MISTSYVERGTKDVEFDKMVRTARWDNNMQYKVLRQVVILFIRMLIEAG